MSRKDEKLKKFYSESFPAIKTQFDLKLREEERIEFKANVLLIIAGVFALVYFSLGFLSMENWGFIPFLPLICVYGLSLYHMATVGSVTPWVGRNKFEEFTKNFQSDRVNKNIINTMYRLTGQIDLIVKFSPP